MPPKKALGGQKDGQDVKEDPSGAESSKINEVGQESNDTINNDAAGAWTEVTKKKKRKNDPKISGPHNGITKKRKQPETRRYNRAPMMRSLVNLEGLRPAREYQNGDIFYAFVITPDINQADIKPNEEGRFTVLFKGRQRHIFGKYRYLVVVAKFPSHCIALPIYSYGGWGLSNKPPFIHADHISLKFVHDAKDNFYQPQESKKSEAAKPPTRTSPRLSNTPPKTQEPTSPTRTSPRLAKIPSEPKAKDPGEGEVSNSQGDTNEEMKDAPPVSASSTDPPRELNADKPNYTHLTLYGKLSALVREEYRDTQFDKNSLVDFSKPFEFNYDYLSIPVAKLESKSLEKLRELYIDAIGVKTGLGHVVKSNATGGNKRANQTTSAAEGLYQGLA